MKRIEVYFYDNQRFGEQEKVLIGTR